MKSEIISLETAKKIEELERENKILNNIIDKAIEYIKKLDSETTDMYEICETCKNKLLDILQGVDKE